MEAAAYLRTKRKRLTKGSYRKYEAALDKLARYFPDLELNDFEPPVGTQRLEEFMDAHWGDMEPRTYNSNLSVVKDFFKWQVVRGDLHGDPTLAIERAKARDPHRETFTTDQVRGHRRRPGRPARPDRAPAAAQLRAAQGSSCGGSSSSTSTTSARRLTVFGKGGTVRDAPAPRPGVLARP